MAIEREILEVLEGVEEIDSTTLKAALNKKIRVAIRDEFDIIRAVNNLLSSKLIKIQLFCVLSPKEKAYHYGFLIKKET